MQVKGASAVLLFFFLALFTTSPVSAAHSTPKSKIRTEVWGGGDDGLSQKFLAALRDAVKNSKDFEYTEDSSERTFRMAIVGNVYWKNSQNKTNFHAVVLFTRGRRTYVGISKSACWEDEMRECVEGVLRDARTGLEYENKPSLPRHPYP